MADLEVDVLVAGDGLAGLTAALFSARYGRSTLVLTGGVPGGALLSITKIDDFPGFPAGVSGFELCPSVQEQAAEAGAEFRMDELERLELVDDAWSAVTRTGAIKASAVIVATGSSPRELGISGESELVGRGVSHCASCDGPLHRERTVGVIGGGDSALQEALELAEHVGEVIIFHRGSSFTGQEAYQRRVLASPQIRVRFGTVIDEISGATAVEAVAARDVETGAIERVELGAVFPCIGSVPRTSFLADTLRLDDEGRIPTDGSMRTSSPGLFAAGDVRSGSAAQAVAVAGDGATAAVAAHRYLLGAPWPSGRLEQVGADG